MADDENQSKIRLSQEVSESDAEEPLGSVSLATAKSRSVNLAKSEVKQNKSLGSAGKTVGFVAHSATPLEEPPPVIDFNKIVSQFEIHSKNRSDLINSAPQGTNGNNGAPAPPQGTALFERRSPFVHNPPRGEERRERVAHPRSVRDYVFNLREELADFQETHGLPRSRDYSFFSLTLALAQETGRALYAIFIMITELFPVLAIISLILRFSLDKLLEILDAETSGTKIKKSIIFTIQLIAIIIPVWITIGTIIMPLMHLVFSIFKKLFRLTAGRGKEKSSSAKSSRKIASCSKPASSPCDS